jgi:hypothetical protein
VERSPPVLIGRRGTAVTAVAGVAYALAASFTRPFTGPADVVAGIPLVVALVVTVWSSRVARRPEARPVASVEAVVSPRQRWWWIIPTTTIVAVSAWELYCFVSLPRAAHPTLSSLIDILDSTHVGKTFAVALWLGLGWFLVAR